MARKRFDLVVLFEHPEWQKPLFHALEGRGVPYAGFDLKRAAFSDSDLPGAPVYFNQASPSAYVRGNTRAVALALSFLRHLEEQGADVLNGSRAFLLEVSKSAQIALLRRLGVRHPETIVFNDVQALKARAKEISWPALLKPEQGGSGARMCLVKSIEEVETMLAERPDLWLPDNLLLLQEYFPHDPEKGIVRMEFLDGKLLYSMRVISHGRFNLCPSEVCNPTAPPEKNPDQPALQTAPPVEFHPFPRVPEDAVETGRKIFAASGFDVGAIEYLETRTGERVFYDINANSNLRPSVAQAFGFDPFERVVDFLVKRIKAAANRN